MITEDYVSFETARLLVKKGFYENTFMQYFGDEIGIYNITDRARNPERYIPAPSIQMAMKWLRENHNLHIEARITNHSLSNSFDIPKYYWVVFNTKSVKWVDESTVYKSMDFDSYEECCKAAVKHCLEHLI